MLNATASTGQPRSKNNEVREVGVMMLSLLVVNDEGRSRSLAVCATSSCFMREQINSGNAKPEIAFFPDTKTLFQKETTCSKPSASFVKDESEHSPHKYLFFQRHHLTQKPLDTMPPAATSPKLMKPLFFKADCLHREVKATAAFH